MNLKRWWKQWRCVHEWKFNANTPATIKLMQTVSDYVKDYCVKCGKIKP